MTTKRLVPSDAGAVAKVHRASFDHCLPWLAGLHTSDEDQAYFANVVFEECELWGSFHCGELIGFIAFRENWIDQFYVLPAYQRRGVGSALLDVAQAQFPQLQLWTFLKNNTARNFYENRGFAVAEQTDGSRNEEGEPDCRYVWRKQ